MAALFRQAMDLLHLACVIVAGTALVLISAVIPWAVYTRYVLNSAASWPEPMAVLLTIVMTFIGGASCYRESVHMRVTFFTALLPPRLRETAEALAEIAVATMALFMLVYGARLVEATWSNSIAEFPWLSVGVTYLPIPVGGACLVLFVIERLSVGRPREIYPPATVD